MRAPKKRPSSAPKLTPLRCWICLRRPARSQRPASICGQRSCVATRERIYTQRRMERDAAACRFCQPSARYGRRYCERHQFLREFCACGQPIPRPRGKSGRAERCAACSQQWLRFGRHAARNARRALMAKADAAGSPNGEGGEGF